MAAKKTPSRNASARSASAKPKRRASTRKRKPRAGELDDVADALTSAAEAVEDGRLEVGHEGPPAGSPMNRAIYQTCYHLSWGVSFPTLLVASILLPESMGNGFADGARAARQKVDGMRSRRASGDAGAAAAATP